MANRCTDCLATLVRVKRYYGGFVCQCNRCNYICRWDDSSNDPWTINAVKNAGQAAMLDVMAEKGNLQEVERAERIKETMCPSCNIDLYLGMEDGSYAFSQKGKGTHYCCSMCEFKVRREVIVPESSESARMIRGITRLGVDTKTATEALRMFGAKLNKIGPLKPKEEEPAKPRKRIQSKSTNVRRRIIL